MNPVIQGQSSQPFGRTTFWPESGGWLAPEGGSIDLDGAKVISGVAQVQSATQFGWGSADDHL